jgi:hypothetical protein
VNEFLADDIEGFKLIVLNSKKVENITKYLIKNDFIIESMGYIDCPSDIKM